MYGDAIRRARARRHMTQADLAQVSGIAQPNISAIEQDRRTPTVDTFHRLLAACGYALVAHDGRDVLVVPAVDDGSDVGPSASPVVTSATPMPTRVRVLTAVLDASEAVVRARSR